MDTKYKVRLFENDTYEVIKETFYDDGSSDIFWPFQGSLADCEAYIRLKQNPDVDF